MAGPSPELIKLIEYLNTPPPKTPGVLSTWWSGKDVAAKNLTERRALHQRVQNEIRDLVAPEANLPWTVSKELREGFKKTVIAKYLTPVNRLNGLVRFVNARASKPQWRLVPRPRGGKFKIGNSSFSVTAGEMWLELARLLETGEILNLGSCLVCQKFFGKKRQKQVCCNPKTCGKAYDNRRRIELKAEARSNKRQTVKQKKTAHDKAEMMRILQGFEFNKTLRGGPHTRRKVQDELLKKLDAAPTVQAFKSKDLPPDVRKILNRKFNLI